MRNLFICVIAFSMANFAVNANAGNPIVFTYQGTGTGWLGETPFTDADFTITAVGDTENLRCFSQGGYTIDHDTASINIAGVGTYDFTINTATFVNNATQLAGIFCNECAAGDLIYAPTDAVFGSWNLLSSLAVSGTGETNGFQEGDTGTTGGNLFIADSTFPATFQASTDRAPNILFTYQGTGTGSLGGTPFTDANFTITAVGDTENLRCFLQGVYNIAHDIASIEVAGLEASFTINTVTFVNNGAQLAGIFCDACAAGDLLYAPTDAVFGSWNLLSSLGPISGIGETLGFQEGDTGTTGGNLFMLDSPSPVTFQASINFGSETLIEEVVNAVQAFADGGNLNEGQANALINKLDSTVKKLEQDNIAAACSKLQAFIDQVNQLIAGGELSAADGQVLIEAASAVRQQSGC